MFSVAKPLFPRHPVHPLELSPIGLDSHRRGRGRMRCGPPQALSRGLMHVMPQRTRERMRVCPGATLTQDISRCPFAR